MRISDFFCTANEIQLWLADIKPSYDLFLCKVCRNPLSQLLQLNGELPEQFPTHDRRLHVLACRRKACSRKPGSIRVLRAVRHSATAPTPKQQPQTTIPAKASFTLGNDIFGASPGTSTAANPFSSTSKPATPAFSAAKPTKTDLPTFSAAIQSNQNVSPSKSPVPWPLDRVEKNDFPKLYLDADYESFNDIKQSQSSSPKQVSAYEDETQETTRRSSLTQEDSEAFESDLDRIFQQFADRLAQNPEQVLRYEFKGKPLLYSSADDVGKIFHSGVSTKSSNVRRGIPGCSNCSRPRTFELQLTPYAIIDLEGDDLSSDGMDWGTVIMGVCEADCQARGIEVGNVGYVEEWVGVQWEEVKK